MHTFAMLNQKGGVGKTSATHHVSGALAIGLRKRVLVVDLDPQASLTQGWWGPAATRELDPSRTAVAILDGDTPAPSAVVHPTPVPGLYLLPGARAAAAYNLNAPESLDRSDRDVLREFLADVASEFDYVLIDCPPNLYGCGYAALAAADSLIVPVQPEDYGAQGIADVLDSLDFARGRGCPVQLGGFLLSMVSPRRTLHKLYLENLRAAYGSLVMDAMMPEKVEYAEAIARRQLIQQYKPRGAASKAALAVALELMARADVHMVAPCNSTPMEIHA